MKLKFTILCAVLAIAAVSMAEEQASPPNAQEEDEAKVIFDDIRTEILYLEKRGLVDDLLGKLPIQPSDLVKLPVGLPPLGIPPQKEKPPGSSDGPRTLIDPSILPSALVNTSASLNASGTHFPPPLTRTVPTSINLPTLGLPKSKLLTLLPSGITKLIPTASSAAKSDPAATISSSRGLSLSKSKASSVSSGSSSVPSSVPASSSLPRTVTQSTPEPVTKTATVTQKVVEVTATAKPKKDLKEQDRNADQEQGAHDDVPQDEPVVVVQTVTGTAHGQPTGLNQLAGTNNMGLALGAGATLLPEAMALMAAALASTFLLLH
ncbi:uncharacterized protein VTP21DRAFT_1643 [Calcarisporiella thermophila]|uniref:uncharacterized protein n=1 Tax=Calcarisporiella thermophila TaxID=911321 RepID=UPI00374497FD